MFSFILYLVALFHTRSGYDAFQMGMIYVFGPITIVSFVSGKLVYSFIKNFNNVLNNNLGV